MDRCELKKKSLKKVIEWNRFPREARRHIGQPDGMIEENDADWPNHWRIKLFAAHGNFAASDPNKRWRNITSTYIRRSANLS